MIGFTIQNSELPYNDWPIAIRKSAIYIGVRKSIMAGFIVKQAGDNEANERSIYLYDIPVYPSLNINDLNINLTSDPNLNIIGGYNEEGILVYLAFRSTTSIHATWGNSADAITTTTLFSCEAPYAQGNSMLVPLFANNMNIYCVRYNGINRNWGLVKAGPASGSSYGVDFSVNQNASYPSGYIANIQVFTDDFVFARRYLSTDLSRSQSNAVYVAR